jgi:tRNA(Leu) C34 or U34 (ribose-2'-O)-methylase TrmL
MSRGYLGIGVFEPKFGDNVGMLWRHARLFNADFIFTVGRRYSKEPTDTSETYRHTPLFHYTDLADLETHLPKGCELILVEQADKAEKLPQAVHPKQAVYLLGAEDHGLPEDLIASHRVFEIPTAQPQSMNVSAAGTLIMYDRITKEQL